MKMNSMQKMLSFILCMVLIAATALLTTGCNDTGTPSGEVPTGTMEDGATIGSGAKEFTFIAVDLEGVETKVTVKTDEKTVGEALSELGLISGEQGDYGLYIKTVNGITLDYDTHGKYWSFTINGEYALTGADMTDVENGAVYMLRPE